MADTPTTPTATPSQQRQSVGAVLGGLQKSKKVARDIYRRSESADEMAPAVRLQTPYRPVLPEAIRDTARLSPQTQTLLRRTQLTQAASLRKQKLREKERASLTKSLKTTPLLIIIFILYTAAVCDILSIVDLGWLVSWSIPIISWFMVRRINAIMATSSRIVEATRRLQEEATVLRRRVSALLPVTQRARLAAGDRFSQLSDVAASYVRTWVRDTAITQLVELIPGVDILPLYLGQVVKMIINQNIEHQKVKTLLPSYEHALAAVSKYERMELELLGKRLQTLIRQEGVESARTTQEQWEQPGDGVPRAHEFRPRRAPRPVRDIATTLAPSPA